MNSLDPVLECLTVSVICSSVECVRLPEGRDSPSDSATVLPVGAPFRQMEWQFWTGLILDLLDGVLPDYGNPYSQFQH